MAVVFSDTFTRIAGDYGSRSAPVLFRKPTFGSNQFNADALLPVSFVHPDAIDLAFKYRTEWGGEAHRRPRLNNHVRNERSAGATDQLGLSVNTDKTPRRVCPSISTSKLTGTRGFRLFIEPSSLLPVISSFIRFTSSL